MDKLQDMRQKSNTETTVTDRVVYVLMNNPITETVNKITKGCNRKIM
jgi:hypothetical protein